MRAIRRDFDAVERNFQQMEEILKETQQLVDGGDLKLPGIYARLPGLYPYYKAASIYCYLLSALGWAAKEILGLKGFLLIFDEAETVDRYDNLYQVDKSQNFLKALIRTANNDAHLSGPPREAGLDYCRVGIGPSILFLYKQLSGLKLLFALTPIDRLKGFPELQQAERIDLQPLTESVKQALFQNIFLLYKRSYNGLKADLPLDMIGAVFQQVTRRSELTRLFVKGSVEVLDLIRRAQGRSLSFTEVLGEVFE